MDENSPRKLSFKKRMQGFYENNTFLGHEYSIVNSMLVLLILFFSEKKLREEGDGVAIPVGWKDTFSKEENKGGVMGKSKFVILFPKYREVYLKECWPVVESLLSKQVRYIYYMYVKI